MNQNSLLRAATIVLFIVVGSVANAQDTDETFGVWRFSCQNGPCQAYFSVQPPGATSVLLTWSLLYDKQSKSVSTAISTQDFVALQPGVTILADDQTRLQVPFQFCDEGTCTAIGIMPSEMTSALMQQENARIMFIPYGKQEPNVYAVPIDGLEDALARLAQ